LLLLTTSFHQVMKESIEASIRNVGDKDIEGPKG
jgi:hypothetical protein